VASAAPSVLDRSGPSVKRIDWQRLTYQLLAIVLGLALAVAVLSATWKSALGQAVEVKRGTMTFKVKLPRLRRPAKRAA
jgi:hypothetical protein